MTEKINQALKDLKKGKIILIYHPEENETAMITAAEKINLEKMEFMKKNASSDVGVAIEYSQAEKINLLPSPKILKAISKNSKLIKKKKIETYPLLIDHINCRTGSSHKDKLMLIKNTVKILKNKNYKNFKEIARYPGHFRFFITSKGLLQTRQGHTELSVALLKKAKMTPVAVMCSMRDKKTGGMLPKKQAIQYALKNKLVFLTREDILKSK